MIDLELIIFPHAGGGPSFFKNWVNQFSGRIKVTPYCLPGREFRYNEGLDFTISELINNELINYVSNLQHPFCFFGHSMGALIAYLLAQELLTLGLKLPELIIISSFTSPTNYKTSTKHMDMNDHEFIDELIQIGGLPKEFHNDDMMEFFLPILRRDFNNCEGIDFSNRKSLPIPITVFGGWQDKLIPTESLKSWDKETMKDYNQFFFPGDHFYLKNEESRVLNLLNNILYKIIYKDIRV